MLFVLNSNIQISQLHSDLKHYGLNPSDWRILKESSQVYKVQSRSDQNFVFVGRARRKGRQLKWKNLTLVSL